jgi:uncharacterized membrane protein YcaP (DUF421 family)
MSGIFHVAIYESHAAARMLQGLERPDEIKYAVLEPDGGISIIPQARARSKRRRRSLT